MNKKKGFLGSKTKLYYFTLKREQANNKLYALKSRTKLLLAA